MKPLVPEDTKKLSKGFMSAPFAAVFTMGKYVFSFELLEISPPNFPKFHYSALPPFSFNAPINAPKSYIIFVPFPHFLLTPTITPQNIFLNVILFIFLFFRYSGFNHKMIACTMLHALDKEDEKRKKMEEK